MKYLLQLVTQATYVGEIELTKAEYNAYEDRLKSARGFEEDSIAQELADKARIELGEPSHWGDLTVDTFQLIRKAVKS